MPAPDRSELEKVLAEVVDRPSAYDLSLLQALTAAGYRLVAEGEWSEIREALSWALDLIDQYDEYLVLLGDPRELVYTPTHLDGKAKARAAQLRSRGNR